MKNSYKRYKATNNTHDCSVDKMSLVFLASFCSPPRIPLREKPEPPGLRTLLGRARMSELMSSLSTSKAGQFLTRDSRITTAKMHTLGWEERTFLPRQRDSSEQLPRATTRNTGKFNQ